jgi:hypothetical protein
MAETSKPSAVDLLAVRSRVSWGAIAAGAMVALTIYVVLTMLGVALGLEMALRGSGADLGAGAAIYSILVLLLAMFFGGWATSRLAVGESKLEAVLYGLILWGVLFLLLLWLLASGMRTGFGALFGAASGAYATEEGRIDFNRVARDLKQAGVDEATVNKYLGYYERVRDKPGASGDVSREMSGDAGAAGGGRSLVVVTAGYSSRWRQSSRVAGQVGSSSSRCQSPSDRRIRQPA